MFPKSRRRDPNALHKQAVRFHNRARFASDRVSKILCAPVSTHTFPRLRNRLRALTATRTFSPAESRRFRTNLASNSKHGYSKDRRQAHPATGGV